MHTVELYTKGKRTASAVLVNIKVLLNEAYYDHVIVVILI